MKSYNILIKIIIEFKIIITIFSTDSNFLINLVFQSFTMKKLFFLIILINVAMVSQTKETNQVNTILNQWHKAAADAKFDNYMNALTPDARYIGTDATENWSKQEFIAFAKPYFDKGKAWSFSVLQRNIYISKDRKTAWFDELLDTQMKICRGSGILIKSGKNWKIQHYVLSMTVPNNNSDEVIKIKEKIENLLIEKLKSNSKGSKTQ